MNSPTSNTFPSSTICDYCSKKRLILICIVFSILFTSSITLAVLLSLKPCIFIKCHSHAPYCINRSLFRGQCLCNSNTAGNGRTVCDECGKNYMRPDARIIGGTNANQYVWPFFVLIRQKYKTVVAINDKSYLISASWMCGGTIINHKTILTAAHCLKTAGDTFDYQANPVTIAWNKYFSNIESTLEVSLGLYDRRITAERRILKVRKVIVHPSYNDEHLLNDIAILKLQDYLRPSATVQFACLPYSTSDVNTTGIVVGFGDTFSGANQGSYVLKQVNLTIYPDEFCVNVSPSTTKNWNTQICCGDLNGERDTCQGDSGGGLYVQRNQSDTMQFSIDGIVSYGEQCASPMKPGIYTRVSSYIDWIQENSDFDHAE